MGSIHGGKGNSSKKLSSTLQKPTGRKDSKSGFFDDLNPLAGAAKDFFNTGASAAGQATPAPSVASPVQKAPSMAAMAPGREMGEGEKQHKQEQEQTQKEKKGSKGEREEEWKSGKHKEKKKEWEEGGEGHWGEKGRNGK